MLSVSQLIARSALPAAAAFSYLDAKYSLVDDFNIVYPLIASTVITRIKHRRGTLNPFYNLESHALDPSPETHNRPFLIYQGQEWTYKQAYEVVLKHATWLKERHGVKKAEIVAMDFTNKPTFLWLWFGLWALGAIPAFLNYNLEGDHLVHCMNVSTATLLLVDDEVAKVLEDPGTRGALEADGKRRVVVFDDHTAAGVSTWGAVRPPDSVRNDVGFADPSILIFTSGTTGMPKPAVVSWRKINYGANFCTRWLGMRKSDRLYTSMPLYHSSAAILGVNSTLSMGSTLVLGHKFSISKTLPELRASSATIFQYVGETCRYLLTAPLSPDDTNHSLRIAFGNGLRPDVWREFRDRFGIPTIAEFYASTEGMSGSWHLQTGEHGIGAIGKNGLITNLLLSRTTKLVRVDYDSEAPHRDPVTGLCSESSPNEPGELIWRLDPNDIKGQFQGYFGNEKASNEKVLHDVFSKGDAWFRTGDIQRRDKDGLWYFLDRIGDTFRWKSENVSTAEVAAVLGTHPDIDGCAVYGVELPRHDGRAGCAAVVLRPGAEIDSIMRSIEDTVKSLPRYARPVFIRVVGELERTGNNKIVKRQLQKEGIGKGGEMQDVWWCPEAGKGYFRFGEEDWQALGRGGVKL